VRATDQAAKASASTPKATIAGTSIGYGTCRTFVGIACFLLLCVGLLSSATPAVAGMGSDWRLDFSFNGSDTTAGTFSGPQRLGIDQSTGDVYVLDTGHDVIDKLDANGSAVNFSAVGASSLDGSGTPDGAFGLNFDGDISIDNTGGANQGRIYVNAENGPVDAFDSAGNYLWQLNASLFHDDCGTAVDAAGRLWVGNFAAPTEALEFANTGSPPTQIGSVADTQGNPCRLNLDASGNLYFNQSNSNVDKFVGGIFASTLDPEASQDVAIDQSSASGHIFTIHSGSFSEFDSAGTFLGTFGGGVIGSGRGIAYNKSLDRVYVADAGSNTVEVFKHVTGTVPDVTINPASNVTTSTASFSGTVNPQGVNNSYHFEWKKTTQSWEEAQSSPTETLPVDSNDHPVSFEATGLEQNTAYNVRLLAANTDLHLNALPAEERFSNIPVTVVATPAAPRTDTSARINASVNPGGNLTTYHFEYSQDGTNWTVLPDHSAGSGTRPIIVAEELTDLQPATTYHYRVIAESVVGLASPQGREMIFTTRTTAEMQLPQRGIELVNSPDKGNQNVINVGLPVRETSAMSANGERVVWSVNGGAPGGTSGTASTFLAKRTASGWVSRGLIPTADQQVGGGEFAYRLQATTPDFSKFIFSAAGSKTVAFPDNPVVVRLDESQHQDILKAYKDLEFRMEEVDLTEDGGNVLIEDPATGELEDIGSGTPEILSLMPGGAPAECIRADYVQNEQWQPDYHIMAESDASRVYFQAKPNGNCDPSVPYGLYVRNRESDETTLIDPGSGDESPELIRATPNGQSAYFISPSQLDPADGNTDNDVYRWDEASGESTCLTCVVSDAKADGAVMVSDDFSHIYFESTRQLIPGLGEPGDRNVYMLSSGALKFVADPVDYKVLSAAVGSSNFPKLSSDGNALLFRAYAGRSLTADAVAASCIERETGENKPCLELYRYEDRNGSLECVSCRHDGVTTQSFAPELGLTNVDYRLSGDGSTAVFLTPEALVRADVNRGIDVYEWRNGVVRLITDGVSHFAEGLLSRPQVLAADADGTNLLFAVVPPGGSLTGFEQDGQLNIYDARIGGGFELPSPPVHCSEDSCQGPLQEVPASPPPSSSSFSGRGNLAPQTKRRSPCARKRGRARRRCIRKHKSNRAGQGPTTKREGQVSGWGSSRG
jgi:hypothetical protein